MRPAITMYDINHGSKPFLLLCGPPDCQFSGLASHTPDFDSPSPTDFHPGTTKKYHPAATAH